MIWRIFSWQRVLSLWPLLPLLPCLNSFCDGYIVTKMDKIGIMGGTFDPIHYGHLAAAEEAAEQLHLPQVIFVPAQIPPHKQKQHITSPAMRLKMVRLATMDNPRFAVSDMELVRSAERPSYTSDTMDALKAQYGEDTEIYFITGADSAVDLPTWHNARDILKKCRFVTTRRPGSSFDARSVEEIFGALAERVIFLDTPALEISSTDIRRRVKACRSIRYFVPPAVAEFIEKEGLYRDATDD